MESVKKSEKNNVEMYRRKEKVRCRLYILYIIQYIDLLRTPLPLQVLQSMTETL